MFPTSILRKQVISVRVLETKFHPHHSLLVSHLSVATFFEPVDKGVRRRKERNDDVNVM